MGNSRVPQPASFFHASILLVFLCLSSWQSQSLGKEGRTDSHIAGRASSGTQTPAMLDKPAVALKRPALLDKPAVAPNQLNPGPMLGCR